MAIILHTDDFGTKNFREYVQKHLFASLTKHLPNVKFLFPKAVDPVMPPSKHIQAVIFPPSKGLWAHKKAQKWLLENNATAVVSFNKLFKTKLPVHQVLIVCEESQLKLKRELLQANHIGVIGSYLAQLLKEKYPELKNKVVVLDGELEFDLKKEKNLDTQELYADGKAYFICADFNLNKDKLITLLKGFSAYKTRLHSNWKLMIVNRSIETISQEAIAALLSNYKYRNDIILTDADHLIPKIEGAYALITLDKSETYPVSAMEAAYLGIPIIANATQILTTKLNESVIYIKEVSADAIGEALMNLYKDEKQRKMLIKKLKEISVLANRKAMALSLAELLTK